MTGEITLRGKVLPVGGIKEKVLAAQRYGLQTVILPRRNEADLDDVPQTLRERMKFILVDTVDEVIAAALTPPPGQEELKALPTSPRPSAPPQAQRPAGSGRHVNNRPFRGKRGRTRDSLIAALLPRGGDNFFLTHRSSYIR